MVEWIPDGRGNLDGLAADIASMFADAEQQLTKTLAFEVKAGLAADPTDVARAINLGTLRGNAERVAKALGELVPTQVEYLLTLAQEDGATAALNELDRITNIVKPATTGGATITANIEKATVSTTLKSVVGPLASTPAAVALRGDLTNALTDVTKRILRWPDDAYRAAVAHNATDVLLGAGTTRTAQAKAWQELVTKSVPAFVDRGGRTWNMASYVETATRTATRRAWDDQHGGVLKRAGVELVTIVVGSGACKACSAWGGKILRTDSGPTGRIKMASMVSNQEVTVNVQGTLDDARSAGWRHPNCRCRPVSYMPGLPPVSDVTTYDAKADQDRAQLRKLERDVRATKLDGNAAMSSQQSTTANTKVRDLQTQIRTHVNKTGLQRQRFREQIDLGNGAPSATTSRPTRTGVFTAADGQTVNTSGHDLVQGNITTHEYHAKVDPITKKSRVE